jgi:hypothetical protein
MLPGFTAGKSLKRSIPTFVVYYNAYEKKSFSLVVPSIYSLKNNNNLRRPVSGCGPCTPCDPITWERTCYDLIPADGPLDIDTCLARVEGCTPAEQCPPDQWHCDDGRCCDDCRAERPGARCCRQVGNFTQCRGPGLTQ